MKEKKKLTVRQKQQRYNIGSKLCLGGEYVSIITPFLVLIGVNYQEWFCNDSGWKVGIGFTIAMVMTALATTLITKKKEDQSITNGFIALVLGWYAVAFIMMLLQSIIYSIGQIMLITGIGMIGALGLNIESNILKKKSDTYKEVLGDTERDLLKEKAKKELEEEQSQEPVD